MSTAINNPPEPWAAPFLRWAGSKRALLKELSSRVPQHQGRYFEPFAGSACLFLARRPEHAIIGDLNRDLIATYETLREHPRLVWRAATAWNSDAATYYRVRSLSPASMEPVERAARFIYLNRFCFNGVYRTNRRGQFNVPFGRDTGALPSEAHLYRCSVALRRAELRVGDFEVTTADAGSGDFVYLDPPYTQAPGHAYGLFGYDTFTASDSVRMIETLRRLDERGATFLFSYADVPEILEQLPSEWTVERVVGPSQVAAALDARRRRQEVLVSNNSVH